MSIFLLVQTDLENTAKLSEKIHEHFESDHYSLSTGSWLVSGDESAKSVSDLLGVTQGDINGVVVVEVASYYGRTNPAVWSWIKDKWED